MKGPAFSLGVVEPDLGKAIAEATGAHCRSDDVVRELLRGATQHLTKFVPELQNNLLEQAQLGLGLVVLVLINCSAIRARTWSNAAWRLSVVPSQHHHFGSGRPWPRRWPCLNRARRRPN